MNNDNKILKTLEDLQAGQKALQADMHTVKTDVETLKDGQAHTNTILKTLATKEDVEVAVDSAKSELKADILMLDSKVVKKIQSVDRRMTNVEDQTGIENPEKH